MRREIGLRWTIGDVAAPGFEALRLAVWGAYRLFGPEAAYTVCVNSVRLEEARARTGELPEGVRWLAASGTLPEWVRPYVDPVTLAEGKAWKFDPLQVYPERWELSFDNDCILWAMPDSVRAWLEAGDPERCLIAADVTPAHGAFARWAGSEPRNAGIRGIPPGFAFREQLEALLAESGAMLQSELDEQGLQVAAASRRSPPVVVELEDVSITSPFPPHLPGLGRCGAHFVGLNEKHVPWSFEGRPATACLREHWERHRSALYQQVGIEPEHQSGSR